MRRRRGSASGAAASEWVGGCLEAPFEVADRAEPYHPYLAVWMELPSGLVLAADVIAPEDRPGAVGRALAKALERPLAGAARRPARIRVADASLRAEIQGALASPVSISIAPTPELDEMLAEMAHSMPGAKLAGSLDASAISDELAAYLHATAELLYQLAPWRFMDDDEVLRLDIPKLGVEGACVSIIGGLGESFGIAIFPSHAAYGAFAAADPERQPAGAVDLGTDWLLLEFVPTDAVPSSVRARAERHGWPLAQTEHVPDLRSHRRDGILRSLTERDVRIAAVCASALAGFVSNNVSAIAAGDGDPICETREDEHPLAAAATLTLPYSAFGDFDVPGAQRARAASRPRREPPPNRNAACPCGSGKKYKQCHLPIEEAARASLRLARSFHELDRRLVAETLEVAEEQIGERVPEAIEELAPRADAIQLALPIALHTLRFDGRTPRAFFRDARGGRLSAEERDWLDAQSDAWLSIWEVTSVSEGAIALRDLLSGERRSVTEESGSEFVGPRDAMLARVVDFRGLSLLCGAHPAALPPRPAAEIAERARKRLRCEAAVPVERLRDEAISRYLVTRWCEATDRAERDASAPLQLTNMDGESILVTSDHFAIDPAQREPVIAQLAALEGAETEANAGADREIGFAFNAARPGSPFERTLIGSATLSERGLTLTSNSIARADALRARVETACGALIRHRAREHADPLSEAAPISARSGEPLPLEAAEPVREFKRNYYRGWLDQPLPALRGSTPRAAARNPRLRAELDLLLRELERAEAREDASVRLDVAALRRELGLDS
jgi:hypothetical protein